MEELKNKIILKKYKIIKRIGKGSFGSVYLGKNINKNDYVAIKLESKNQNDTILERETYILYTLKGFGIPEVISYGQNNKYNILIQELLGKSIDKIFFEKKRKFSMKDCCMIGIQILDRLEYIHSKSIIHRDIKADNFLVGLKKNTIIYIIDFGLAKQYRSRKTGKHVKYTINKKWSGTSRFASANTLRGVEPSRRDDLESFCYLLLYLMKGSLPWDQINEESEINEILIIYKMKQYMTPEMLFRDLPLQMIQFYKYCKNLEFEQKPDYNFLRGLLLTILNYNGEQNDLHFSWIIKINLNKCKNVFAINKSKSKSKEKEKNLNNINSNIIYKKEKIKSLNSSKDNIKYNNNNNIKKKNIINLDHSTGKINKKEKLDLSIKNNILGHCNIIKRKYIKSQSPIIKRVTTDEDKYKKKIIPKKSIVIDLTNYIETKKANEIKSYKTKLFNYKNNEKNIKNNNNQSEIYGSYKNINEQNNEDISNSLIKERYIKSPKNLFYKKIFKTNNISESSTFTKNNINNTTYIKNDKNFMKINGYYFKEKPSSPNITNKYKKINVNNKLNIFEESKNGYVYSSKKKKLNSNSLGKDFKNQIKTEKKIKDLEINNSINNLNKKSTNNIINKKNTKELTILIPRRQKTVYTFENYKYKNFKNIVERSFNKESNKNRKNMYHLIYINNNKKYIGLSPNVINRKKTEIGLSYTMFQKKNISDSNNNLRKIMLNKNSIKKDKINEDKKLNYIVKNNFIKEQIYSSYNNKNPRKKISCVINNVNNPTYDSNANKF